MFSIPDDDDDDEDLGGELIEAKNARELNDLWVQLKSVDFHANANQFSWDPSLFKLAHTAPACDPHRVSLTNSSSRRDIFVVAALLSSPQTRLLLISDVKGEKSVCEKCNNALNAVNATT